MTTQADDVILYSAKSDLFVQIKLTEDDVQGTYYVVLL